MKVQNKREVIIYTSKSSFVTRVGHEDTSADAHHPHVGIFGAYLRAEVSE